MILGLSISTFTTLHVVISLIGIASGFVVLNAMLSSKKPSGWIALFLATTILTSATGFMFPIADLTPALIFGLLSIAVLAVALLAYYQMHLRGPWRWLYIVTALVALYLNTFVAVVQSFQKIPLLSALAPTQSEAPFLIAQTALLVLFLVAGYLALRRFHPVMA